MMKLCFPLLFVLFLSACSSQPKNLPRAARYSPETEKTFQDIERERLMEHYRQLRIQEGIMQQTPGAAKPTRPQIVRPKPAPRPQRTAPTPPPPKASSRPSVDAEAQNMELEQNLSFFCMQKRKESRFSAEGSCEEFTAQIRNHCLEQHQSGDRGLLPCVKSRLK